MIPPIVWGPFVLIPLLLLSGAYLTLRLGGVQFRTLPHALWLAFVRRSEKGASEGDISHFQAVNTALAATVGVGNIAGVATGIQLGGPGALFWMFVTGVLGMATKYSEALLGVKYRRPDSKGEMSGGPMFYLTRGLGGGLGWLLGVAFAVFGAVAAFGIGNMAQANSVSSQLEAVWGVPPWASGAVMVLVLGAVAIGGIRSIGRFAAVVVPFMCLAFIASNVLVLVVFAAEIPAAVALIVSDAFTGTAATGGFAGATVIAAVQWGFARGIFSNESGMGTGAIAAASARTDHPVRQAMVSMTQTFVDTVVMLSLTGLMIVVTGAWTADHVEGAPMTALAVSTGYERISPELAPLGGHVVAVGVCFFAFCTILGWSYYGERCVDFLAGRRAVMPYRVVFLLFAYVGAVLELRTVWLFSDIANGLMALPNLLGVLLLSPVVVAETRRYFARPDWRDPDALVDVRA
ncbi:sodium:alanine symporter family protein [Marinitenerispora sediminis]|uniref:Sodium:alanine symporter family protein n=2 Tax=Marinitenerispora sediminis TaxID=1931232 RepID=A0A368T5M5_9ACTN|nr:sodium:alanine symporter family protein [Marinitenerispora sediminis]RCV54265.1 sodium:alanine symporter family protein [Marinitenerispora sediminis]RCV54838.1 sodium:alanine symporter family protein [Marinitenerispora sediminis]